MTYQAFYQTDGTHLAQWGSSPDRQRGNTKDEDATGLLNEGFRYRDLETLTFITRDPAGFVDGPNLYAYVNQNPWSKFDPEGLALFGLYDTWGQYGSDMLDIWKGYGDASNALMGVLVHMASHPIDTANGIGNAVLHPIDTSNAIVNDAARSWNSGNRGAGKVVGDILLGVASAGVGAEVSAASKAAQASRMMAVATKAIVQVEKTAMTTAAEAAELANAEAVAEVTSTKGGLANPRRLVSRQGPAEMTTNKVNKFADSMRENGFDPAHPIEVANVEGQQIIIDGHHRAAAAVKAGIREVPVTVTPTTPEKAAELARQAIEAAGERGWRQ